MWRRPCGEALRCFGNASRLQPNDPEFHEHLGTAAYESGDLASGNQIYGQNFGIDAYYGGAASDGIAIANNIVRSNYVTGIQALRPPILRMSCS